MEHDAYDFLVTFRDFCQQRQLIEDLETQIFISWNAAHEEFHISLSGADGLGCGENGDR